MTKPFSTRVLLARVAAMRSLGVHRRAVRCQAHAAFGRGRLRDEEPPVSPSAWITPDDGEER